MSPLRITLFGRRRLIERFAFPIFDFLGLLLVIDHAKRTVSFTLLQQRFRQELNPASVKPPIRPSPNGKFRGEGGKSFDEFNRFGTRKKPHTNDRMEMVRWLRRKPQLRDCGY